MYNKTWRESYNEAIYTQEKVPGFFPLNEYHFTLSAHPVGMGGLWMPKKFNLYTERIL